MPWDAALVQIKELGFKYVDLAMFEGWTHISPSAISDPVAHGQKIAEVADRLEIEPIALHSNFKPKGEQAFPGLTTPDPTSRNIIFEHFQRVAVCASEARIPLVNVQPGKRFL